VASRSGFGGISHLARRFVEALQSNGPTAEDEEALCQMLSPQELVLYQRLNRTDRAHAVANMVSMSVSLVALKYEAGDAVWNEASVGPGMGQADLLVAAAMHDVGKSAADLSTLGRVFATVVIAVAGRRKTAGWARSGRIGLYADHPRLGAEMLQAAGAHAVVVAWATEHHQPRESSLFAAPIRAAFDQADRA
jgi:hypothetical protein